MNDLFEIEKATSGRYGVKTLSGLTVEKVIKISEDRSVVVLNEDFSYTIKNSSGHPTNSPYVGSEYAIRVLPLIVNAFLVSWITPVRHDTISTVNHAIIGMLFQDKKAVNDFMNIGHSFADEKQVNEMQVLH